MSQDESLHKTVYKVKKKNHLLKLSVLETQACNFQKQRLMQSCHTAITCNY